MVSSKYVPDFGRVFYSSSTPSFSSLAPSKFFHHAWVRPLLSLVGTLDLLSSCPCLHQIIPENRTCSFLFPPFFYLSQTSPLRGFVSRFFQPCCSRPPFFADFRIFYEGSWPPFSPLPFLLPLIRLISSHPWRLKVFFFSCRSL